MQYKVPQDVQREDTIIGSITFKQMGILAGGGGFAYMIYISLAKNYFLEIWLPPVALIIGITLAFAFLKIHSLTFTRYLICLIEYWVLPRKRIWIKGSGDTFESYLTKNEESAKKQEEKTATIENKKENLKKIIQQLENTKLK